MGQLVYDSTLSLLPRQMREVHIWIRQAEVEFHVAIGAEEMILFITLKLVQLELVKSTPALWTLSY